MELFRRQVEEDSILNGEGEDEDDPRGSHWQSRCSEHGQTFPLGNADLIQCPAARFDTGTAYGSSGEVIADCPRNVGCSQRVRDLDEG